MAGDGRVFLTYTDDEGRRSELFLDPRGPRLTLGRSADADLALPWDQEVSRVHATVECLGGQWLISDDGLSRNGTFVNGERIAGRRRLHSGDRIRVGGCVLTFRQLSAGEARATAVAGRSPAPRPLSPAQRTVLVALCRPFKHQDPYSAPATNQQIADELFLSVDAVKTHLRALFAKFGVEELPHNHKRLRLVELALQSGVVSERDL